MNSTAPGAASALPALALAAGLTLAACGDDGSDTATTGLGSSSGEHGAGHPGSDGAARRPRATPPTSRSSPA